MRIGRERPRNPFASLVAPLPGERDPGAATQVYEVPRELIELARTRATGADGNALTPLAPRPSMELEHTLRMYTGTLSSAGAVIQNERTGSERPAPRVLPSERPAAPRGLISVRPEAYEPMPDTRPSRARQLASQAAPEQRRNVTSHAAALYVALLAGLGYCAHLLAAL